MQSPHSTMLKWDNIMSPQSSADPVVTGPRPGAESAGILHATELAPAGLPDPATLARMANEFFTALPGGSNPLFRALPADAPFSTSALSSPPVTAPAAPSEISLPSDPHFPGAPASAAPSQVSPVSAPVQATPPVIPGVLGNATPSETFAEIPAFLFLQEARPIFPDGSASAQSPYPPAKPIT